MMGSSGSCAPTWALKLRRQCHPPWLHSGGSVKGAGQWSTNARHPKKKPTTFLTRICILENIHDAMMVRKVVFAADMPRKHVYDLQFPR